MKNHHLCKLWTEDLIWLKDQPSWFPPSPKEWDITFLEFLLWLFLPISALLFILGEHIVHLPKTLLPGLTTTLMIRDFCILWFWGNCIPSLFIEPHQGSRVIAEDKIASQVYKKNLWPEMTFCICSLHRLQLICEYIYIYILKFIESFMIGINKHGKKSNWSVGPINKISGISIRVSVCPL